MRANYSVCSNTDSMKIIAVVPARGGSKRLPGKSLLELAGKPLIAHSIEAALDSGCFTEVIASTDCPQIAEVARKYGARVPVLRPPHLADDKASSLDMLIHATQFIATIEAEVVCLLQPTSPLRNAAHIQSAIRQFVKGRFTSLSSMTRVFQFPEWLYRRDPDTSRAIPESIEGQHLSSADIPERYIDNGAIYLVKTDWLLSKHSIYDYDNHGIFVMSAPESIDIDYREDFDQARYLLELQK